MKKIAIAVLSAVCVFALAGCADDVTMDNEQNDIVAEYIAGTLLRHSYANEWKYSKLSNPTFKSQDRVQQLLERIILLVQQQLTSRQQQPWDRQVRQVQQEQLRQVLRRQALLKP